VAEESAKGILSIWRDDQDKPFAQVIQKNIVRTSFASDRGLMWQSLAVHGRTECPAVTIDSGFITNPTESAKLKTDEYQQRIAQGIADGIIEYINIIDNNE